METQIYGWEVVTLVLGANREKIILNTRLRCFVVFESVFEM